LPEQTAYQKLNVSCEKYVIDFCNGWKLPILTYKLLPPSLCQEVDNRPPCIETDPIMNNRTSIYFNITLNNPTIDESLLFSNYWQSQYYFDNKEI
jgi:hypothetical protein